LSTAFVIIPPPLLVVVVVILVVMMMMMMMIYSSIVNTPTPETTLQMSKIMKTPKRKRTKKMRSK